MNKWFLILLLVCTTTFSQERTPLLGKVIANGIGVTGIFVINKATGSEVKTDATGNFSLPAKPGDKIAVYSTGVNTRDFAISEASFKEMPYVVEVDVKGIELDEVVVETKVTSQSLGLVPKNYKFPTAAENRSRRYAAAAAPGFGVGYLVNAISGQLYYLKLAATYAKKEELMQNLGYVFTEDEIISECKIPKEYVKGFLFYAVENKQLSELIKVKNKGAAKLLLMELAVKYTEILKHE